MGSVKRYFPQLKELGLNMEDIEYKWRTYYSQCHRVLEREGWECIMRENLRTDMNNANCVDYIYSKTGNQVGFMDTLREYQFMHNYDFIAQPLDDNGKPSPPKPAKSFQVYVDKLISEINDQTSLEGLRLLTVDRSDLQKENVKQAMRNIILGGKLINDVGEYFQTGETVDLPGGKTLTIEENHNLKKGAPDWSSMNRCLRAFLDATDHRPTLTTVRKDGVDLRVATLNVQFFLLNLHRMELGLVELRKRADVLLVQESWFETPDNSEEEMTVIDTSVSTGIPCKRVTLHFLVHDLFSKCGWTRLVQCQGEIKEAPDDLSADEKIRLRGFKKLNVCLANAIYLRSS